MDIRNIIKAKLTPEQQNLSKALFHIFGVKTGNIYIYQQAFRHKSIASEVKSGCKDSYERLEFLGDAVIGVVIAEFLFRKYPFKSEGFLTDLRSKIVCGKFLSKTAQKMGLEKLITIETNIHNNAISGALGDVMEAVIGAIFIDKGFAFTKKVILERIIDLHVDVEGLVDTETNFKSRLIEWAQKEKNSLTFHVKDNKTVRGKKQFTIEVLYDEQVLSEAVHNSIKEAEQLAAEKAIDLLKGKGLYE